MILAKNEVLEDAVRQVTPQIAVPKPSPQPGLMNPAVWICGIAAAVLLLAAAALIYKMYKKRKVMEEENMASQSAADYEAVQKLHMPAETTKNAQMTGKVHNIGKRKNQQDSFGVSNIGNGRFAVVADGMGGLAEGDKVSQKIVFTMLQDAAKLSSVRPEDAPLYRMLSHANQEVMRMLGTEGTYKSGSTVTAVLAGPSSFQWVSVGDSRIYLYRENCLMQINREHIYETELLKRAVNQEISFAEAQTDAQRKGLTSFVGMGELKYIDGSLRPVEVRSGDKILLMSDGVFNTLPEQEICQILAGAKNADQAAAVIENQVLARQNPKQDNFTAVILDF